MNNSTSIFHLKPSNQTLEDSYLKLSWDKQTFAVLSIEFLQEVLIVPAKRMTSMPNMPNCVLGLLSRHNRVFWVIDLAQMLKLEPLDTYIQQYNVAIIQVEQELLGLAVQEIKGVTQFQPDSIQSPQRLATSHLMPYLHGCITQRNENLLVLNAEAIMRSPILSADNSTANIGS